MKIKKGFNYSIKKLEDMGYNVFIEHYRILNDDDLIKFDVYKKLKVKAVVIKSKEKYLYAYPENLSKRAGLSTLICPKGGATYVELKKNDVVVASGFSYCSLSDNYNKKIGVAVIIGRLIKSLREKEIIE